MMLLHGINKLYELLYSDWMDLVVRSTTSTESTHHSWLQNNIYNFSQNEVTGQQKSSDISARVPLEQVGVEGEEAVQRVGVGGHTVPPCRAADHWQHVAVVPLYDGVAEHHLILPATKTHELKWTSSEENFQLHFHHRLSGHGGAQLWFTSQWFHQPLIILSDGATLHSISHSVNWCMLLVRECLTCLPLCG